MRLRSSSRSPPVAPSAMGQPAEYAAALVDSDGSAARQAAPTGRSRPPRRGSPSRLDAFRRVPRRAAEELSDDDLLEVTTMPPAPPEARRRVRLERAAADEHRRSARVVESLPRCGREPRSGDRERPRRGRRRARCRSHTPPPESGPQEAVPPAGFEAPRAARVRPSSRAESRRGRPRSVRPPSSSARPSSSRAPRGPTIEIDVGGVHGARARASSAPRRARGRASARLAAVGNLRRERFRAAARGPSSRSKRHVPPRSRSQPRLRATSRRDPPSVEDGPRFARVALGAAEHVARERRSLDGSLRLRRVGPLDDG